MKRTFGLVSAAALGLVFMAPVPAQAEATVFRFSESHTEVVPETLECWPNQSGIATVTETSTGQVVDTGNRVFTVHGVNAYDYRLDFSNGQYVQSSINRDRYVFVASGQHTVYHVVIQDFRTLYDADGQPVGQMTIHAGYKIVYTDRNDNFQPDPNEITVEDEYFTLRCR